MDIALAVPQDGMIYRWSGNFVSFSQRYAENGNNSTKKLKNEQLRTKVGSKRGPGRFRSMRLSACLHGVGKALDGELAQLVPQAGLTSAQTDAVIPAGTAAFPPARWR